MTLINLEIAMWKFGIFLEFSIWSNYSENPLNIVFSTFLYWIAEKVTGFYLYAATMLKSYVDGKTEMEKEGKYYF